MVNKSEHENSFSDPVPLEIYPWWSGIYALEDWERAQGQNSALNKIPAILSAYATEFGELCLLMHVLDYTQMEGGRIGWCNWTGVGYSGGNRVRLYDHMSNDDWYLHFDREEEIDSSGGLSDIYLSGDGRDDGGKEVATFLLPYLPKVKDLSIWDGISDLAAPESLLSEIRETSLIKPLLGLEVIPLVKTCFDYRRENRYEMPLGKGDDVTNH